MLLYPAIAPVVVDGQIGFTYHKNVECTSAEVYNAFTETLLNNINNFGERYGVSFYSTFKHDFSLKDRDTCLLAIKTCSAIVKVIIEK